MGRRTRELRPDERDLWQRVARTATPLSGKARAPLSAPDPEPGRAAPPAKKPATCPIPVFRIGEKAGQGAATVDLVPSIADSLGRQSPAMDRKAFLKMKRGKLTIDGRVDLHGLTLAQAQPRLTAFVLQGHAAGHRLVLVITGKGKDKPDVGPIPERRGVLKNQVPQWLTGPALRHAVMQVTEAHRSHGGSGAYYVYLRRAR